MREPNPYGCKNIVEQLKPCSAALSAAAFPELERRGCG